MKEAEEELLHGTVTEHLNQPVGINQMLSCVIFNPHISISMVRTVQLIIGIRV